MPKRTLLPLALAMLFAAHASAQKPAAPAATPTPAKPKTPPKTTKPRTPAQLLAAYIPKVKAALGAKWADAVNPRMADFAVGSATVTFKLDADGGVAEFAVTANTSNEPFAKFCEEFVRSVKFEKPPAGALTDGLAEIPFTFTIL